MKNILSGFAAALALSAMAGVSSAQTVHELKASPATVHRGFFDGTLKPVLTIDSSDIVKLWTATGNPKYYEGLGVPKDKIPAELYAAYEGVKDDARGDQSLNGPIAVKGAMPGDTIEIRFRSIEVWLPIAAMSFRPNRSSLPEDFPYSRDKVLWMDLERKTI
ncbi:MAG TPA: hypothetical protein VGO84_07490, partial [Burkholderiales bacterium]|nr:hypothetical protein [Burkholderiales bacterium]